MAVGRNPHVDIEQEARRILAGAAELDITTRLLGGVGIALLAKIPIPEPLRRTYGDIDLAVTRHDAMNLTALLLSLGYVPNQRFNNLHGSRRLLFYDEVNQRQLDVFIGSFRMCHELDLDSRLTTAVATLTPADLLLTKLQIVEVNAKDLGDAAALLYICDVAKDQGADVIDLRRLVDVLGKDWGWYTSVRDNLDGVAELARNRLAEGDAQRVIDRISMIRDAIDRAPKSVGWKLRARIGRRVQWYELPEEVAR